ncbi:MFS transporter [Micromonospora sp. NPDC049559]|uniref:MFS transporter n=1 Tax=Micromonospora sp. NPDC049559 TaxID=3155923 RepID=UPI00342E3E2F
MSDSSTTLRAARPARAVPPSGRGRLLLGLSLGYFMVLLDTTVLTVALPDLARDLGGSVGGQQWAVNGYTVAFAALLLTAGAATDRYGAHRVFRAGVAAFGVLSLLSAAAPALGALVALRAALGVAGAACLPSSLALIARAYPVPAERARAMGAWAAITGVALGAGPVVGGLLVEAAGWRAVFLVNVPLAAVALALTAGSAIRCPTGARPIDRPGQLVACALLALGTDAIIAAGERAGTHALLASLATVGTGALLARRQRSAPAPVLPADVIRAPGVRIGLLTGAGVNFTLAGALFVLTLLLQERFDPIRTGLAFLPLTLPTAVNPLLTGRLVARHGPRPAVLAGLALITAGTALLAGATLAHGGYPPLAAGLALLGFGISFALPALVTGVVAAAPAGTAGTAGGLLNAVRQVGAALGVAVMGAPVAILGPGRGAGYAFLLATALCAAVALLTARRRPARPATGS